MSRLPPLADVVAVRSADPTQRAAAGAQLAALGGFDAAWGPAPGWVAAARPFADSGADEDAGAREAGLLFAQGADVAITPAHDAAALAELVRLHPERLDRVTGDFGFIAFAADGAATVVRSASGLVPFYVAATADGGWTVATSLELILRLHPDDLPLDPLVNAIWTSGYDAAPERRTFLTGVRALGRGEFVHLGAGHTIFGRWWRPWEGAVPRPAADHGERLRAALLGTLERELDPSGGNLLALSGGVDSSAVGALAAGELGYPVDALTVLPEDPVARARDLAYIDGLDGAVGLSSQRREEVGPERRIELLDEPGVPFHVLQPYLCLLRSTAAEQPVRTLFGGEFADHTVGSTLTLRDWTRHTSALDLWRHRRSLPTGRGDVRRWFTWRLQAALGRPPVPWPDELPALIRPELRGAYADWLADRRRAAAADDRPLPYLVMFLEREGFLGMHWEMTSALGIRRAFPFVSRALLELAFELHPSELVGPGTKRLLRAALADDVPARNLQRPDKGHPGDPARRPPSPWSGESLEALDAILTPGWPPPGELPYWDRFRAHQLLAFTRARERARLAGVRERNAPGIG